jgi:hypothetical protein
MTVFDDHAALTRILRELDPRLFRRTIAHYERGGYPSGHPGFSNTPKLPVRDQADRFMAHQWSQFSRAIHHARELLEMAARYQTSVVVVVPPVDDPDPVACENKFCTHMHTMLGQDKPRDGLCARCYQHRRRYGRDWPYRSDGTRVRTADKEYHDLGISSFEPLKEQQ